MTWRIWALGSNGNGQLAVGHCNDVDKPTPCLFDRPVDPPPANLRPKKIAAGGNHTVLLYEDGSVYAAGLNDDGRCGLPPSSDPITTFRRVVIEVNGQGRRYTHFDDITATWSSTIFLVTSPLTKGQEIWSCGTGYNGELGQGSRVTESFEPGFVMYTSPSVCVNLASSFRHVVAIMNNGFVYGWGNGRKGQLGTETPRVPNDKPAGSVWKPFKVADLRCTEAVAKSFRLACGRDFTYMVQSQSREGQSDSNAMACWLGGSNKKDDKYNIREQAPMGPCKELHASWNTLHAIDMRGEWHSVGRNDKGQILANRLKGNILQNIKAGSEHSIAQISVPGKSGDTGTNLSTTLDQCVVLWGWGEHGNIGPLEPGEQRLGRQCSLSRSYSIIRLEGARLEPLGAGCATSFLMADVDERSGTKESLTLSYMAFPLDVERLLTNTDPGFEASDEVNAADQLWPYWQVYSQTELSNTP